MDRIRVEHLPWDSALFGCSVGRLALPLTSVEPEEMKDAINRACEDLTYVFLPVDRAADFRAERLRHALVEMGGKCVDLKVTYRKRIVTDFSGGADGIAATHVTPALEALAYASGWNSRFVKDERLERFFRPMYLIWLKRDIEGGKVFVRPSAEAPEGLATVSVPEEGVGKIGLVAVDAKSCRKGIATALMKDVDRYLAQRGVQACSVVTQGTNTAARHLYEKVGFQLISQYEVWHVWKEKRNDSIQ